MQHLQPNTTLQGGKYRIERVLGQGGFGNTYKGYNTEFEETVAIKEFFMKGVTERDETTSVVSVSNADNVQQFEEQREKFKKEARRLRKLKNEHIVKVHDLFEENSTAYYVMDFIDGESLAEKMKMTGQPFTEAEVRSILSQILEALKEVHQNEIWHLDLKPGNIMIDKSGNAYLIDFGASKQIRANGSMTTSTALCYTPGYAPNEQIGQMYDRFGPWTDIYALGATLYNLLTNKRPPLPTDIDDDETADKHEALPFPDTVSSGTKSLVLMMLNTNRMRRPQSIDAILEAELLRKKETVQDPLQQTTPKHVADDDEEATIIANPQPKKEEKDAKPKPEPQPTVNPQPTQSTYTFTSLENNDNEGSGKGFIIFMIVAFVIVVIILATRGCGNKVEYVNEQSVEKAEPQNVEPQKTESVWESPLGSCQYTGPVDKGNLPHGRGEAKFSDGRYYSGGFSHGAFNGEQCYFTYPNGDSFFGEFRYNSFYQGKYTISKDGSYFKGYFKDGQPSSGTWYDKNGKVIEKI